MINILFLVIILFANIKYNNAFYYYYYVIIIYITLLYYVLCKNNYKLLVMIKELKFNKQMINLF